MPTALDQILSTTRSTLPELRARRGELERAALRAPAPPPFLSGWTGRHLALIAEVKRRSPSAGTIRPDLEPAGHAAAYSAAGASAISVLTDGPYFGGSLDDLRAVVARVRVPVLRKDFIIDETQLFEARAAGAAAVLLIVRALTPSRLGELARVAGQLGLATLVEAHDAAELEAALSSQAPVIGINSRSLDTFTVDVDAAWRLLDRVPADRVAVAESGMAELADVERAAAAGADAVLIGTALSSARDPGGLAARFAGVARRGRAG
jgi:indole-3-glycerol phosphate synthase